MAVCEHKDLADCSIVQIIYTDWFVMLVASQMAPYSLHRAEPYGPC